jgi:probable HAF family extracellular repeat protein
MAFLWTAASGMSTLGALTPGGNSQAFGVNASGDVVGASDGAAFVFHDGRMLDLTAQVVSSTAWQLNEAVAINDQGQIVGTGTVDGQTHAFLLSPVSTDVPEPAGGVLVSAGLLKFWIRRRKRECQ